MAWQDLISSARGWEAGAGGARAGNLLPPNSKGCWQRDIINKLSHDTMSGLGGKATAMPSWGATPHGWLGLPEEHTDRWLLSLLCLLGTHVAWETEFSSISTCADWVVFSPFFSFPCLEFLCRSKDLGDFILLNTSAFSQAEVLKILFVMSHLVTERVFWSEERVLASESEQQEMINT